MPSGWSKVYRGGSGESRESGESSGSADVALVLEMANCNKGKDFQFLLRLLKVQIRRAGSGKSLHSEIFKVHMSIQSKVQCSIVLAFSHCT